MPEGVIPLDVMHCLDHKTPQTIKYPILNTNNTIFSLGKKSPVVVSAGNCEQIQEAKWSDVTQEPDPLNKQQLLPKQPSTTNLQLKLNTPNVSKFIPDADIPKNSQKETLRN